MSPKQDIVFKMLFGDQHYSDILAAFLKAVLLKPDEDFDNLKLLNPLPEADYEKVTIENSFVSGNDPRRKKIVLDVHARLTSGKEIDVEMQVHKQSFLAQRVALYVAQMLASQSREGQPYRELCPAVCILITAFDFIENPHYHNRYTMFDPDTGSEFTDLLEINVLDLTKIPATSQDAEPVLVSWLRFLNTNDEEERKMLAQTNPDILKAYKRLEEISDNPAARLLLEAHRREEMDFEAFIYDATQKGLVKGRVEGREEERMKYARKMLAKGQLLKEVRDFFDLSDQEVQVLQAS
jgi:predicted transposase/invertase (TIGR01784 family)